MSQYRRNTFFIMLIFFILYAMEFYGGYFLAGLNFAFPMDDPYIHLAMGKNLALHGNWGPMAGEFNSSSSSILYTLIISLFYFLGIGGISTLFIINIVSSIGCLFAFEKISRLFKIDPDRYMIMAFSFVLIVPLYHIAYLSMEHTLHIWIMLSAARIGAKYLSDDKNDMRSIISLSIITALAIMTRYESLFFGLIIGVILLYRKQFKHAVVFGLISLIPITIFGLISIQNGEHFLPNSVLVKGVRVGDGFIYYLKYGVRWIKKMYEFPDYGLSLLLVAFLFFKKLRLKERDYMYWFSFITLFVMLIHGSFADIGWLGRYEGYLIALSLVCLTYIFRESPKLTKYKLAPFVIMTLFVLLRTANYTYNYRYGMHNIRQQQYQMAMFVKEYYDNEQIVLNDIGTTSFYTNAKYLDLWALASTELANYKLENDDINEDIVAVMADKKNSKIAIIYNESDYEYVPQEWTKVASWTISNRQVSNNAAVYFYAINTQPKLLREQVVEFSKTIPSEVKVDYFIPEE